MGTRKGRERVRRMLFSGWLMGSRFASARSSVPQSVSWMSTENTEVGGAWNLEAEGGKPAEKANSLCLLYSLLEVSALLQCAVCWAAALTYYFRSV